MVRLARQKVVIARSACDVPTAGRHAVQGFARNDKSR